MATTDLDQEQDREQVDGRVCARCGRWTARADLVLAAGGKATTQCKACRRDQRYRAAHGPETGAREVKQAPDSRPAVRLRLLLARARSEHVDVDFEVAFEAAMPLAVQGLTKAEAGLWRDALRATEAAWRAGWERRATAKVPLSLDLIDGSTASVESTGQRTHLVA